MPFNNSGNGNTFSRVHNWVRDRAARIGISASRMDTEFDGIATALSNLAARIAALTDAVIGDKAFSNPPNDLNATEQGNVRTRIGLGNYATKTLWSGTQAQYDAIATKDTDTIYHIIG